jgi:CRP/FNR family cyclic AMP-dependent transcriptional regulator
LADLPLSAKADRDLGFCFGAAGKIIGIRHQGEIKSLAAGVMDQQLLAQALGKLRFSAALPENVLEGLAQYAQLRKFLAGTTVFREGDLNDDLMIISVGRVTLEMHVPDRGDVRILSLGPGELLAWSALLADGRMTTSATAL